MVFCVPEAYLEEYCAHIYDLFKLTLTKGQLSKFLKEEGINKKKVHISITHLNMQIQKEARERDPILRGWWLQKLGGWRAEQLIFLDESGINPRTTDRTDAWSKKGKVVRSKVPGPRRENFSVLSALTVDGYIACNIYQGAVNGELFKDFVEFDVLPHCTPYPGPKSVIILDNAAIHNVQSTV
jgi:hypothetical protein